MRGNDFLDKMELIDPAYIEAADVMPKKKTVWTGWRAAVAACVCLVLLAGTAAAVSGRGTWLIEMFTDQGNGSDCVESGYTVGAEIRKFPVSELPVEIQAAGERIAQQYADYLPYSSKHPGNLNMEFSTAGEAKEFIGPDLLKWPEWDLDEWGTTLIVWGSSTGRIKTVTIDAGYESDGIVLQANAEIYTEYSDDEDGRVKVVASEEVAFTENFYTTASGKLCQVISSSAPLESGYWIMDGYMVDEGIRYALFMHYSESDAARAEALLRQWADMF